MNRPHENELAKILIEQYKKYPLAQISDMLKLIHQNEFGCGHMVSDMALSLSAIIKEAESLPENTLNEDVAEYIGNGVCRLHLRALKQSALSPGTLAIFFAQTAGRQMGCAEGYESKAAMLISLCENRLLPFEAAEISQVLDKARGAGYPPHRHSEQFRAAYAPAYRVAGESFCEFLPLFCRIDELMKKQNSVAVAIDGKSSAGKSSLAALLKSVYSCNVFSMDDFFLRPFQKTPERLNEPGGNIDYERFGKEVIEPLKSGKPFAYRPYNCQTRQLAEAVAVTPNPLNVIEGAYSLHPHFTGAYDIGVFLCLDDSEQNQRLAKRNPLLHERFVNEWAPMENKYFEHFKLEEKTDLVFNTGLAGA